MHRKVALVLAAVAAAVISFGPAHAEGRHKRDKVALSVTSAAVGAGMTAAYFALNDWNWKWDSSRHGITSLGAMAGTTIGCAALSPIVATAVLQRPLTYREAHVLIGSCIIPVIGGWLVNEAYKEHILWAPDEEPAPAPVKRTWRRHARR